MSEPQNMDTGHYNPDGDETYMALRSVGFQVRKKGLTVLNRDFSWSQVQSFAINGSLFYLLWANIKQAKTGEGPFADKEVEYVEPNE